jgi:hypothetical protein
VRMSKATTKLTVGQGWIEGMGLLESGVEGPSSDGGFDSREFTFKWHIEHRVRTYGYYLVIADCNAPEGQKRFKLVSYDIRFLNDETDHFPADEHGLFTLYVLCFLGLLAFAARQVSNAKSKSQSYFRDGPPPAATSLLFFAYGCEMLSLLLEILHLWWYGSNGYGIFFFDFFSEVFEGISQTALSYLLIAFACGWTLIEGAVTFKSEGAINPEAIGEDHAATLFLSFLTMATLILQILNKLVLFDDFTKFHDHESWPGYILVFVRTLLACAFTYSMAETLSYQKKRGGRASQTLKFMKTLAVLGGLWFWVFPVLVLVASFFAHYLRHRIVGGGVLFLQTSCLLLLTRQILAESSTYNKASVHGGLVLGDTFSPAKAV